MQSQVIRATDMALTLITVCMETSCGLVLLNYDSILLLQYPQGHWDFVKGHFEESDGSHEATALRELEEETGISKATISTGFKMRTQYEFSHKGTVVHKQVHWCWQRLGNSTTRRDLTKSVRLPSANRFPESFLFTELAGNPA